MSGKIAAKIDSILASLETVEPTWDSLGTPEPAETEDFVKLVAMGEDAVPHLIARASLRDSPRQMAYIAKALGRIGDPIAVTTLRELRQVFQAKEPKNEWDFAVIGQCNVALSRLTTTD